MDKRQYERFRNQLLEIIAYSNVQTFIQFCEEHKEEVKEFRRYVRIQTLIEQGFQIDDNLDVDSIS